MSNMWDEFQVSERASGTQQDSAQRPEGKFRHVQPIEHWYLQMSNMWDEFQVSERASGTQQDSAQRPEGKFRHVQPIEHWYLQMSNMWDEFQVSERASGTQQDSAQRQNVRRVQRGLEAYAVTRGYSRVTDRRASDRIVIALRPTIKRRCIHRAVTSRGSTKNQSGKPIF
jgi:uncharacterized protein (DUF2237 family)